jgi:UDP-3-O-[3-hydroxymyristoyl] N-acetylglucosamine deacetylase
LSRYFRRELARARTFGFMRDVAKLWSAGYALGASFDNTLVVNEGPSAQSGRSALSRRVRPHKALDAIGDLALAGRAVARCLSLGPRRPQAQPRGAVGADGRSIAWVLVEGPELRPEIRPESRQEAPRRAIRGHADLATGLVAPAYGPDVS